MHPAVETLTGLMPPGDGCGDTVDWRSVEEAFGTALPGDFREFIGAYGIGSIDDQLEIGSPEGEESGGVGMLDMTPRESSARWIEQTGSGYPLWPAPGSLICWGRLKSYGEVYGFLYWRSVGPDPDRWPVVVWKRSQGFEEHPHGMAEFLVRLLEESGSLDLDMRDVFGAPHSRFLHWREEERLKSEGVDPWEYLDDLHEALDDPDNDIAVEVTGPDGEVIRYRHGEVPAELEAQFARMKACLTAAGQGALLALGRPGDPVVEAPKLALLGVRLHDGVLSIDASIALGTAAGERLLLSAPPALSVRTHGPHGEVISSAESPVIPADPAPLSDRIEVTGERPFTFSVSLPGFDAPPQGTSLVMSVVDEGIGAFRASAGIAEPPGTENTLLVTWFLGE